MTGLVQCQTNVLEWDIWSWCQLKGIPVKQHYDYQVTHGSGRCHKSVLVGHGVRWRKGENPIISNLK